MPLGKRIRKAREHADISQAELARRIGISKNACTRSKGGIDPRAARIVAIAQELGVNTDALLLDTPAIAKREHKPPALRGWPRTAAPVG
jgi:transcriptional regulator with XRE-family HTH domain